MLGPVRCGPGIRLLIRLRNFNLPQGFWKAAMRGQALREAHLAVIVGQRFHVEQVQQRLGEDGQNLVPVVLWANCEVAVCRLRTNTRAYGRGMHTATYHGPRIASRRRRTGTRGFTQHLQTHAPGSAHSPSDRQVSEWSVEAIWCATKAVRAAKRPPMKAVDG